MENIKHFDITNVKKTSTIIIIGKRSTGKTTLIKNILLYINDINNKYIIFDPYSDIDSKGEFKYLQQQSKIYDIYDEEIVKVNMNRKNDEHKIIIIDNALYSANQNKTMQNAFMNCRFYQIGIILSLSYGSFLNPNIISNTDFIFIFKELSIVNQTYLYTKYFKPLFITLELFLDFFNQFNDLCSKNEYTCLVLSNVAKTNYLEDRIFLYKANNENH